MTIKWVQQDPLVLNGEPFCYGSRLTVRQLLELRSNGYDLTRILIDHPELPPLGAGEPSMRPLSAAIANAIFDATGVRIRRVPFSPDRVKQSMA